MTFELFWKVFAVVVPLLEVLGIITAIHAVYSARSSQGAIAWAVSLIAMPIVTLPLYWIFGRNKFNGYVETMRSGLKEHERKISRILKPLADAKSEASLKPPPEFQVFANMAKMPFSTGNRAGLLIDGTATFEAMFTDILAASHYILLQYFIVHDDGLGRELKERLIQKTREGVRVFFLYDEIGCHALPDSYTTDLIDAGVEMTTFGTTKGKGNRFQLNFRNHRKITVIDGKVAYLGGHNIGDAYLGENPKFGRWRDTHMKIEGPAVGKVQISFLQDWYWATNRIPDLNWEFGSYGGDSVQLAVLPTGPIDPTHNCSLMFVHAIHAARERIWIASPYFIPNEPVLNALQLAALRGVKIRIMLPLKPDHRTVYLASFHYLKELDMPGIRFYRYTAGFLHQKVFLVDRRLAAVGTANADNRSFHLNFEITVLSTTPGLIEEVDAMLTEDFANCREVPAYEYDQRNWFFKLGVKLTRLLSPVL